MTITRCDYVPRPGKRRHRCPRPAVLRVLHSHGAGVDPEYQERCLQHARAHLGPLVAAVWDMNCPRSPAETTTIPVIR